MHSIKLQDIDLVLPVPWGPLCLSCLVLPYYADPSPSRRCHTVSDVRPPSSFINKKLEERVWQQNCLRHEATIHTNVLSHWLRHSLSCYIPRQEGRRSWPSSGCKAIQPVQENESISINLYLKPQVVALFARVAKAHIPPRATSCWGHNQHNTSTAASEHANCERPIKEF